jgi:hypothetical protein
MKKDLIFALCFILFVLLSTIFIQSCSNVLYRSPLVTHVLAITETGDTLKIPISDIKPTQIYNVVGYNYNPYYTQNYRDWRFYYDNYRSDYRGFNSFVYKTPSRTIKVSNNPSNTTGGGNSPVAVNPVTQGGGSKKKYN